LTSNPLWQDEQSQAFWPRQCQQISASSEEISAARLRRRERVRRSLARYAYKLSPTLECFAIVVKKERFFHDGENSFALGADLDQDVN
jgi:hypothetical protein